MRDRLGLPVLLPALVVGSILLSIFSFGYVLLEVQETREAWPIAIVVAAGILLIAAFINSQHRLHVFHLPKYSPDWNPDEKVWNHLKHQELKGHQARTKAQLKQLTHDKLKTLSKDPRLLRGIFFRCCVAELLK